MGNRLAQLLATALALCALGAAPAWAYEDDKRWEWTATNGPTGPKGTPVTVTWSFAPDGTHIPGATSNLISFLDANFGAGPGGTDYTLRPWFSIFDQSFARLSALSGLTTVYEPHDDGATFNSFTRGILGVRGDERLGGKSYGSGNNTLASNFYPDYAEMMINTDQAGFLANPINNYRPFRNTLMHELLHGMGLSHVESSDARFLLEPTLGTSFDGPQLDDILGLQRLYGDALEKNGGNDSAATATPLGALSASQPLVRGSLGDMTFVGANDVDFLSIDDDSDIDFFHFTIDVPLAVTISLTPKGATYQVGAQGNVQQTFNAREQSNLSLELYDANGVVQLGPTANANGVGLGEIIERELNPGAYLARVTGAHDQVQLYRLELTGAAIAPDNLTWVGFEAGVWNQATTANFNNGSIADVFRNGDHVTFGNGAATTNVIVSGSVAPATMAVNSTSNYSFVGSPISVSQLSITGGGRVTLANNGNTLNSINLSAGSLVISGTGNAPLGGAIRVAAGATLELVGPQSFATTSELTGGGRIIGDIVMPGTISPGEAIGALAFADDLTLTGASVLEIEIGGLSPNGGHDVLNVLGDATLDGTLAVTLVNGYLPTPGSTFTVVNVGGTKSGLFSATLMPSLGAGLQWHTTYSPHEVVLSVSAAVAFAAADFNKDGFVDGADLQVWRAGFGIASGATHEQGDANGDSIVNVADFLIWQRGLNNPGDLGAIAPTVPEPSAMLLGLGALGALATRRRSDARHPNGGV